jgi:hypothetical protein
MFEAFAGVATPAESAIVVTTTPTFNKKLRLLVLNIYYLSLDDSVRQTYVYAINNGGLDCEGQATSK